MTLAQVSTLADLKKWATERGFMSQEDDICNPFVLRAVRHHAKEELIAQVGDAGEVSNG
jgi:hypothetical protein